MRFLEFHLAAYGPFTGVVLDLSRGKEGLHVLYGPNEAGKSSALRAIHALLFGIHGRTTDNFVHPYGDLRIGARISDGNGTERTFWRIKRNKDALRDADDQPVEEHVLAQLLGGVTDTVFTDAFGLDHDRLVQGGEALLAGGGKAGESLFAAGLGSDRLRSLLTDLGRELDELFKRGASKPMINERIAAYGERQRLVRETSLAGSTFTQSRRVLSGAEAALVDLDKAWSAKKVEHERLRRIERALPRLAQRKALLDRRCALLDAGLLPVLPAGFEDERRQAQQSLSEGHRLESRALQEIDGLEAERGGIEAPAGILERGSAIEEAHGNLSTFRKAASDRIQLEAKRQAHEREMAFLLRELHPDLDPVTDELPVLTSAARMLVQELADAHAPLAADVAEKGRAVEARKRQLQRVDVDLAGRSDPPDPAPLRRLVLDARRRGDLEARLSEATRKRGAREQVAEDRRSALGTAAVPPDAIPALPVPELATIEDFEARWAVHEQRRRDLDKQAAVLAEARQRHAAELDGLERGRRIPTENDLEAARCRRETGWRLVRQAWVDGTPVDEASYDPNHPLAEAYEIAVRAADDVVDHLRVDAQSVARKAELLKQQERDQGAQVGLDAERGAIDTEAEAIERAWRKTWAPAGVQPRRPRAMRTWLESHASLVSLLESLREQAADEAALRVEVETLREGLAAELARVGDDPPGGATLAHVLDGAETRAAAIEDEVRSLAELRAKRAELARAVEDATAERKAAQAAEAVWAEQWATAVAPLGLGADTTPATARHVRDLHDELQKRREAGLSYVGRITGIDRDAKQFAESATTLARKVAPDLIEKPPEELVLALYARLAAVRKAADRGERIERDLARWRVEVAKHEASAREAEAMLARLCVAAGVQAADELEAQERRAREAEVVGKRVAEIESELLQDGKGLTLELIEAQAAGIDGDTLAADIEQLAGEIEGLDKRRGEARERLGEARKVLDDVKPTADAARHAEEAEEIAAEIQALAGRYVRLKLARAILQAEIERYRAAHQAPLLARAREIFQRITCGAFAGLESDETEDGTPILLGVRPGGGQVAVQAMSDGTREQLYLALRLASLEQHLESGDRIPLIVDDILLRSDDERSRAILDALADLSRKTQVLFFTHQSRHVDMASGLGRPDGSVRSETCLTPGWTAERG